MSLWCVGACVSGYVVVYHVHRWSTQCSCHNSIFQEPSKTEVRCVQHTYTKHTAIHTISSKKTLHITAGQYQWIANTELLWHSHYPQCPLQYQLFLPQFLWFHRHKNLHIKCHMLSLAFASQSQYKQCGQQWFLVGHFIFVIVFYIVD